MSSFKKHPRKNYTNEEFYDIIRVVRDKSDTMPYALISLDFDNFNFINDLFGYDIGDIVLKRLEKRLVELLAHNEYFLRHHSDHFLVLIKAPSGVDISARFESLSNLKHTIYDILPNHYNLICSAGIIMLKDSNDNIPTILDKANYARKQAKGNHFSTYLMYDEGMDRTLNWKKKITLTMESGLYSKEFCMYLQPKMNIQTGEICGAEALIRWHSQQYGIIYPDDFIPILEQNGFIKQLDFFMLEEACSFINNLISLGKDVIPISVNFSKIHMSDQSFVKKIHQTVIKNNIPPSLIEIEITESVFLNDLQTLIDISNSLKSMGFKVSLDDFGSAYSSLNYLKDMPLDTIKIDKGFLRASADTNKGIIVISRVIDLIKSLNISCVMEGIETEAQVELLQKLHCDTGQGYFYARPMPASDFMEFLFKNKVQKSLADSLYIPYSDIKLGLASYDIPKEFKLNNREIYALGKATDDGLIKCLLAQDSISDYINDKGLDILGYTRQEFREMFFNKLSALVHPEDVHILNFSTESILSTLETVKFSIKILQKNKEYKTVNFKGCYAIDNQGQGVGIYSFKSLSDAAVLTLELKESLEERITALDYAVYTERMHCENLNTHIEKYKLLFEQSEDIIFDWDFKTDHIEFSEKFGLVFDLPLHLDYIYTNEFFRKCVHQDDILIFDDWLFNAYKHSGSNQAEFRLLKRDSEYVWIKCHSTTLCDENDVPIRAVGVFSNIQNIKSQLNHLTIKSQLDPLTLLYNKEETKNLITECIKNEPDSPGAFLILDIDHFKGVNDTLGHQYGDRVLKDVSDKIKKVFRDTDIIGRIGGDELVIYMRGTKDNQAIINRSEILIEEIRMTYFGVNTKYSISGSVGIALYPKHGQDFQSLYELADTALYKSKANGRNQFTIYALDMSLPLVQNVEAPVEGSKNFLNAYFDGDPIYSIFKTLYETKDINTSVNSVLMELGKRFNIDRVYLFQYSDDLTTMSNTHEWCCNPDDSRLPFSQNISAEKFKPIFAEHNREGLLFCHDIDILKPNISEIFKSQRYKSILHCLLYNDGEVSGFIGFGCSKGTRHWRGNEIATIGYISHILSVFLAKKHMSYELGETYSNHIKMLNHLHGYVYVVDLETYKMLYINNAMRELGIEEGTSCHYAAFGRSTPCEKCQINALSLDMSSHTADIYSEKLQKWVSIAAKYFIWSNGHPVAVVVCSDISHYKNNNQDN